MSRIDEAVKTLRKATSKWHLCDEKTKALDYLLSEVERLAYELEKAWKQLHEEIELEQEQIERIKGLTAELKVYKQQEKQMEGVEYEL